MGVGEIEVTRLWRNVHRCTSDAFPEAHFAVFLAPVELWNQAVVLK